MTVDQFIDIFKIKTLSIEYENFEIHEYPQVSLNAKYIKEVSQTNFATNVNVAFALLVLYNLMNILAIKLKILKNFSNLFSKSKENIE